jgi:hypothetical protein
MAKLFASCGEGIIDEPLTSQTIDLRTYLFPIDSLLQPKIFCYADSSGKSHRYCMMNAIVTEMDTSLLIIRYDSLLRESSRETNHFSKEGYTIRDARQIAYPENITINLSFYDAFPLVTSCDIR